MNVKATPVRLSTASAGFEADFQARLHWSADTDAAIELMQMAGCRSVAVITELVDDDGIPLSGERLSEFAFRHDIPFITVDALVDHCKHAQDRLNLSGPTVLPTEYGTFHARSYLSIDEGVEHLVLTYGPIDDLMKQRPGVLARVHSECMTGDLIRSRRCDCGTQLDSALQMIVSEGAGVLIYMRGHEGRGIGLGPKLSAYTLQDAGYDTVDANTELGLPVDDRDYSAAVAILHALDVRRVRLITNNPDKVEAIEGGGVRVVGNVTVPADVTDENIAYLLTKRERMGHSLQLPTKSDSIAE